MDSFELNKILGAILGTLVLVMGVGFIADAIYAPIEGRGPGYTLPEPDPTAATVTEDPEPGVSFAVLLASASVEAGAGVARSCAGCHSFGEGEGHRAGPNLWDTVGQPIAGHEGYSFSDALVALREEGETWTFENLDAFLASPAGFAPGTRMAFPGVANDSDRADLIAYMASLSNDPVPLPEASEEEIAEAEDEAPAGDPVEAAEEIIDEQPAEAEPPIPAEEQTVEAEEPVEIDDPAPAPAETQETLQPGVPDDPEPVTLPEDDAETPGEAPAEDEADAGADVDADAGAALLVGSADAGAEAIGQCLGCHSVGEDEGHMFGPNLFGVFGEPIAAHDDFAYTEALEALGAAGEIWDAENLDAFLADTQAFAPGTMMAIGEIEAQMRADIIAYLESLEDGAE